MQSPSHLGSNSSLTSHLHPVYIPITLPGCNVTPRHVPNLDTLAPTVSRTSLMSRGSIRDVQNWEGTSARLLVTRLCVRRAPIYKSDELREPGFVRMWTCCYGLRFWPGTSSELTDRGPAYYLVKSEVESWSPEDRETRTEREYEVGLDR